MNNKPLEPIVNNYATTPTKTIISGGVSYAYRELGPAGGVPVVFFTHLGATLDNWDPRRVDAIATHRHVITFDQRGVGASTGQVRGTIEEAADDAYDFITALRYDSVDAFSFSLGAMIAQDLVLKHPALIRKLILTGTGPRGGEGIEKVARTTYGDMVRAALTRSDPKEYLFFNRDTIGKAAGEAFIRRLGERTAGRDKSISTKAFQVQLKAIQRFGRSTPADLSLITQPTFITNGDNDRMVPSGLSRDMQGRIAGSQLVFYPNSGHGSIFQYAEEFATVAADFLAL